MLVEKYASPQLCPVRDNMCFSHYVPTGLGLREGCSPFYQHSVPNGTDYGAIIIITNLFFTRYLTTKKQKDETNI